jgi:hypothetical protein
VRFTRRCDLGMGEVQLLDSGTKLELGGLTLGFSAYDGILGMGFLQVRRGASIELHGGLAVVSRDQALRVSSTNARRGVSLSRTEPSLSLSLQQACFYMALRALSCAVGGNSPWRVVLWLWALLLLVCR